MNHPATAGLNNNIGMVLDAKGNFGGALLEYRKALAIHESVLGKEHTHTAVSTAVSRNNIGLALRAQGDYVGALESHENALNP
jgi:tetratricopeptide (TPR) repeat protein